MASALVSATLEAPKNFDPVWRAIIGSHTDALARSCATLELTVLAFRKAWYDRVEKTLDPERLKYLSGFVDDDHLAYIRTTARGECAGGGASAACTIPDGTELEKRPSKRIRDLGDEAWNQYWTTRIKLGRGLCFSYQTSKDLKFSIVSAPQLPVEKTDTVGNVRVGKWRLVTDHSYPASRGCGGQSGASNTRATKFHHSKPPCPTAEHVSRMSLEYAARYPGVGQKGFKHDTEATYNLIGVRASDTKLFGVLLADSFDESV